MQCDVIRLGVMSTVERGQGYVRTERGQIHARNRRGRLRNKLDEAKDKAKLRWGATKQAHYDPTETGPAERTARKTGSATLARAGQRVDVVGAVLSLIIVAVIAYVGLDVIAEVETNTDVEGNSNLSNASKDLDSGVEGAFSLLGVVFLVILLAVIIGLFLGLRR